jgi:hypothetical protein
MGDRMWKRGGLDCYYYYYYYDHHHYHHRLKDYVMLQQDCIINPIMIM